MYRLKPQFEAFEVVSDGRLGGQEFIHNVFYTEVPRHEAHRFETISMPRYENGEGGTNGGNDR